MGVQRVIFVTVGTTLFEKLVEVATSTNALQWMQQSGYTHLIVQYGKGQKPQMVTQAIKRQFGITVELYDFKPSLQPDMAQADIVISHAGAGTISEALQLAKPRLMVVVNTLLMDNHQLELARAMERRNYLFVVESPDKLVDLAVWNAFEQFKPSPLDGSNPHSFVQILGSFFGWGHEVANEPR